MNDNTANNHLLSLKNQIAELIIKSSCLARDRVWVNIDHAWHIPEQLDVFSALLAEYLSEIKETLDFNHIILADKIVGPFGPIPLFILASQKMNPKIQFIIWKEWARPISGEPRFFGIHHLSETDKILICHDVIAYGTSIVKMIDDLKKIVNPEQVVGVLSICMSNKDGDKLIMDETGINPLYIVHIERLKNIAKRR